MPIDTLAFAEGFEGAGFGHDQARALAAAFGRAHDAGRDELATRADIDLRFGELDTRFAELEGRLTGQMGELELRLTGQMSELELRLAGQMGELELRLTGQMGELELRLTRQLGELEVRLTRQIAEVGKEISSRLWSTVTIIAGVSTAISATIGAGVALILKWGGL